MGGRLGCNGDHRGNKGRLRNAIRSWPPPRPPAACPPAVISEEGAGRAGQTGRHQVGAAWRGPRGWCWAMAPCHEQPDKGTPLLHTIINTHPIVLLISSLNPCHFTCRCVGWQSCPGQCSVRGPMNANQQYVIPTTPPPSPIPHMSAGRPVSTSQAGSTQYTAAMSAGAPHPSLYQAPNTLLY